MGELAALVTSVCWTFTGIFFTFAGRQVGSVVVNRTRLVFAVLFLTVTHQVVAGYPLPLDAEPERWFWLGLSGIIGLVIGDAALFQAFVLIGPRISTLMMALVPVISTMLAWVTLNERLNTPQLIAVGLTVGGIAWVVLERGNGTTPGGERRYGWGILFGLVGAVGQAVGLITAKKGLAGGFSPLSGVLIRMVIAMAVLWTFTALRGQVRPSLRALRNRRALAAIAGGAIVGPFLGVWSSLIAVSLTDVGIASTLMALPPVFLLPVGRWLYHERITARAVLGTGMAMAGVAMIFLL